MKQFARCSSCRQWYSSHAVTTVEILRGNGQHRTAMWCQRCIQEAEQRSLYIDAYVDPQERPPPNVLMPHHESLHEEATGAFADLLEEHLELMEDAIQEDDDAIAARIGNFMERCRAYSEQLDDPAQSQRLKNHLNYWQTFLNMLNHSSQTDETTT